MRTINVFIIMAGALMCAPAFTACQDDPEPVNQEKPESPSEEDPEIPDEPEKSWFDLPEEERWPIRWFFEDEDVCHGPGEYEFRVPTSGDEFTFWFPDCGQILKWMDLDGVVELNYYGKAPVENYRWNEASYKIIDENCVKIMIAPNGYPVPHKYVFSFHNRTDGGIVRFIFHQDAAESLTADSDDGNYLFWNFGDEHLISYHRWYVNNNANDYFNKYYLDALVFYPDQEGGTFAFKCLNGENLEIKSLIYWESGGKDIHIEIKDPKRIEHEQNVFKIRSDSLVVELTRNDKSLSTFYLVEVSSGNKKTKFTIRQRWKGVYDKGKIYPYDPEWTVVEDGSRWTGGSTDNGVFRIPAEGDTITVKSTGLYNKILVDMAYVDGRACPNYTDDYYFGYPDDYDSAGVLGGVISYKHKNWDSVEFGILPNYTGHERVVKVKVSYDVFPIKSVVYSVGDFFNPISYLFGYDYMIFVQPPINPSGK